MGAGGATEQGMAPVQGGDLAYEVRGAGPPLTLLHMDGLDRRMWDDQFAAFAARYRVLRYDARGHGASARSLERRAPVRDLVGLLRAAGVGPTALLGIDEGGGPRSTSPSPGPTWSPPWSSSAPGCPAGSPRIGVWNWSWRRWPR